jgi:hypothetical protein
MAASIAPRDYIQRQLISAHNHMERVYAAYTRFPSLSDAYVSAQLRLRVAERRATDNGYAPSELVAWNTELQAWRVVAPVPSEWDGHATVGVCWAECNDHGV